MNLIRKVAVVIVVLGSVSVSQADLVKFQFSASFLEVDDLCGDCSFTRFVEDTGLGLADRPYELEALFTIDTDVEDSNPFDRRAEYLFDGSGTGLSVTVGSFTVSYDQFTIIMFADEGEGTGLSIFSEDFAFLLGSSVVFEPSLETLVKEDLSEFGESLLGVSSSFYKPGPDRWGLITSARSERIARVAEPSTLALLGIGLLGMGLMRRRRIA